MWILLRLPPSLRRSSPTAAASSTPTRHPILPPLSYWIRLPLLLSFGKPTVFILLDAASTSDSLISHRWSLPPPRYSEYSDVIPSSPLPLPTVFCGPVLAASFGKTHGL
ncbi:hypothetical protein B0H13DRAFT_2672744 [Mycena leptocephala]|nr:hypothetical protein B0H13DRAFT_2672744 [Mycena leptocephala]